jgi:hypothetical protein
MHRTRLLSGIIVLVLAAALVVAVALWPRPVERTGATTPSAIEVVEAGPPEIPWVWFSQLPPDGGPGAFVVQAGIFGEIRPRVDVDVPWVVDTAVDIARTPAVARPVAGAVIVVADDGGKSTIHRIAIEPGARPEPIAEVDDTVWSIAAAPDGSVAYLALVARGRPDADRGVVRVALDGSGAVEPFLPPVAAASDSGLRLAAIAPFTVTLDLSADGRYLARTACRGVQGCATSLIELSSGAVVDLGETTMVDLGTGGTIVAHQCGRIGCAPALIDLETGAMTELPDNASDTTVMSVDGHAAVVTIETAGTSSAVVLTDPRTGARRELYRAPDEHWLGLGAHRYFMGDTDEAVLVVESSDEGGRVRERLSLVPLAGGAPIDLPVPAIRQIGPPAANG